MLDCVFTRNEGLRVAFKSFFYSFLTYSVFHLNRLHITAAPTIVLNLYVLHITLRIKLPDHLAFLYFCRLEDPSSEQRLTACRLEHIRGIVGLLWTELIQRNKSPNLPSTSSE